MCIKLKKEEKLFGTLEKVSVTGDRGDCLIQVRGRFAVHTVRSTLLLVLQFDTLTVVSTLSNATLLIS